MPSAWAFTMPDRAPLYVPPPYPYRGVRKLSVFCRANPAGIRRALPQPLETVSDVIELFVMRAPDAGWLGDYSEGGVVIPCRYKGVTGGHVAYEYVSSDDSLCVGREIWGYPKKMAEVAFEESSAGIRGLVGRRGTTLIDLAFAPGGTPFAGRPKLLPRLQMKRFARVDGRGFDMNQIILNDFRKPEVLETRAGSATARLGSRHDDPLEELGPMEVLGAEFAVFNFVLDYGQVFEELERSVSRAAE